MRELGLGPCFLEPAQGTMAQYEGKHGPARYGYGPCLGRKLRHAGDADKTAIGRLGQPRRKGPKAGPSSSLAERTRSHKSPRGDQEAG